MRKILACSMALWFALLLTSCSKNNANNNFSRTSTTAPDRIIDAKVAPGQTYSISIANSGDVKIGKQAAHYLVSETGIDEKNNSIIYRYSPASGFKGIDEVLLTHVSDVLVTSNGGCNYGSQHMSSQVTSIAVKITVAD